MMLGVADDPHVQFAGLCGMYGWEREEKFETQNSKSESDPIPDRYVLRRGGTVMEITRRNVECWDVEQMVKILKRGYVECDPRYGNATEDKPPVLSKLKPSAELQVIVGAKPLTAAQAMAKVFEYVKQHNLIVTGPQGRYIQCDQTLAAIMPAGGCEEHECSLREIGRAIKRNLTPADMASHVPTN